LLETRKETVFGITGTMASKDDNRENDDNKEYIESLCSGNQEKEILTVDQNSAGQVNLKSSKELSVQENIDATCRHSNFMTNIQKLNEKPNQRSSKNMLSWRDPDYTYERTKIVELKCKIEKENKKTEICRSNWREKGSVSDRKPEYNYEATGFFKGEKESIAQKTRIPECNKKKIFYEKHWDLSNEENLLLPLKKLEGSWSIMCNTAELENVWKLVNQLYAEKTELFVKKPWKFQNCSKNKDVQAICCSTSNYTDKHHVSEVAKQIRKIFVHFPYIIYYFISPQKYKFQNIYMSTCEGDLYERYQETDGWKMSSFSN